MGIVTFYKRNPFFRLALTERGWKLENEKLTNPFLTEDDSFDPYMDKDPEV